MTKRPTPRKFQMTRKRADYVENRDTTIKGDELRLNVQFQNRRAEIAEKEVDRMAKEVEREVRNLFKSPLAKSTFAMDASLPGSIEVLMNGLSRSWQKRFNLFGREFSKENSEMINSYAAKDLGQSMRALSGGMTIKTDSLSEKTIDIIRAATNESSSLIKTISTEYMSEVKESLLRSIVSGSSSFEKTRVAVNDMLTTRHRKYRNKAKNIVLDQTRKAYQGINQQRMREIGINEFEWVHVGGSQNPRAYHKFDLNGRIFDLNDPPVIDKSTGEKGLPGQAINCKCIMRPVIKFNNASS